MTTAQLTEQAFCKYGKGLLAILPAWILESPSTTDQSMPPALTADATHRKAGLLETACRPNPRKAMFGEAL
eukprot:CAMPEP_0197675024 /NCGR_PEP_ID=MMETSP1338-20131121/84131_1 /TAXON_ID=43686 ORGANISM="Pelagodinium beii, Strain RCC1491" /NCGR_SAMPLE_ID=MMETSP1338 /ASSEMBLY_ACC=CAM_ASM_000754 /LENGTH=70 /DNA_ID=CAMNT_0043255511 /DNA_START=21 /DNA_END=230 /DNA_ORIENTATION=+